MRKLNFNGPISLLFGLVLLLACEKQEQEGHQSFFSYNGQSFDLGENRIYYNGPRHYEEGLRYQYVIYLHSSEIKAIYDAKGSFYRARGNGPIVALEISSTDSLKPAAGIYSSTSLRYEAVDFPPQVFDFVHAQWQHNQYTGDFIGSAGSGRLRIDYVDHQIRILGVQIEDYERDYQQNTTQWLPVELDYWGDFTKVYDATFP